jgi:UDP-N-acetylmuramoyl-L-alanyl-D-glutamate--2,6-diaminopimelate ligase
MPDTIKKYQLPVVGLQQLCQGIIPLPETVDPDMPITGITFDSRRVKPGNCFVAITGYQVDGHVYIDEAVSRGAACLIVEKEVHIKKVPVLHVKNSRSVLALLASRYFGKPSENMTVIGITGTNGKTTTAYLMESICQTAGKKTGLIGTMLYRWNGQEKNADRTTPESVDIQRFFWEMNQQCVEVVVMEVSSHALVLDRVLGLDFDVAVFTNLSRDHLDFHKTLSDYEDAKAMLFQMIKKQGVGILNGDDPVVNRIQKQSSGRTVLYGEKNQNVHYLIKHIQRTEKGTTFSLQHQDQSIGLSTRLWGHFNVMNAAAAAITGLEMGFDHEVIQRGIDHVHAVRGRMEGFIAPEGFRVIVDYAHTPDALKNILIAVRELTGKRVIVVFGCGGDRDKGKRPQMGRIGSTFADEVFITSDNPRSEDPKLIIKDILRGITSNSQVKVIEDRREAIYSALDEAGSGDTVVLAGKGHETYQQIGTERIPFDDRAVAEAYLYQQQRA